jgi:hypothetical protein
MAAHATGAPLDLDGGDIVTGDDDRTCSICGELFRGLSNSAAPVQYPNATFWDGRCCDACNAKHVIPARLGLHRADLRARRQRHMKQ